MEILTASLKGQDWRPFVQDSSIDFSMMKIPQNSLEKKVLVFTLIWELCSLEDPGTKQFLMDSRLLPVMVESYISESDRIVQSRVIDILNCLFKSKFHNASCYFYFKTRNNIDPLFHSTVDDVSCILDCILLPLLRHPNPELSKITPLLRIIGNVICQKFSMDSLEGGIENGQVTEWYFCLLLCMIGTAFMALEESGAQIQRNGNDLLWTVSFLNQLKQRGGFEDSSILGQAGVIIPDLFLDLTRRSCALPPNASLTQTRQVKRITANLVTEINEALGELIRAGGFSFVKPNDTVTLLSTVTIPLQSPSFQLYSRAHHGALDNLIVFVNAAPTNMAMDIVSTITQVIADLLKDANQPHSVLERTFQLIPKMFKFDTFHNLMLLLPPDTKLGHSITESITTRLYDLEWDIRDATIDFIKTLFVASRESNHSSSKVY
ncbi:hypothetical protein BDR26DRAFT_535874 [Obelidium mucronatum]|nr:hypothetical protein BDR26DRAFT_535874 [Obelidium mucronatum]